MKEAGSPLMVCFPFSPIALTTVIVILAALIIDFGVSGI